MATIRVQHGIDDLASDLAKIPPAAVRGLSKVVRTNVRDGNTLARRYAREKSGIHGKNAWKRLTGEMTGALSGEYGWTGDASQIVGAGFRNGPPNTDLERTQDIIGPKLAKDAGDVLDNLFWPS